MKTLKLPNLTSSLVRPHRSYVPSLSAASWPLIADPTILQQTTSGHCLLLPTSPTLPCSGGNPPWSLTLNHQLGVIGVSLLTSSMSILGSLIWPKPPNVHHTHSKCMITIMSTST